MMRPTKRKDASQVVDVDMGRDGIEPSTSGLKVVHLALRDAETHYDTPRNTLI
jgi:hypothetical protein